MIAYESVWMYMSQYDGKKSISQYMSVNGSRYFYMKVIEAIL